MSTFGVTEDANGLISGVPLRIIWNECVFACLSHDLTFSAALAIGSGRLESSGRGGGGGPAGIEDDGRGLGGLEGRGLGSVIGGTARDELGGFLTPDDGIGPSPEGLNVGPVLLVVGE